jgi:hypothetical protein
MNVNDLNLANNNDLPSRNRDQKEEDLANFLQLGVPRHRRPSSLSHQQSGESDPNNLSDCIPIHSLQCLPPPSDETNLSSTECSTSTISKKHRISNSFSSLVSVLSANNVTGWGSLLFPQQSQTETTASDQIYAESPVKEETIGIMPTSV